LLPTSIGTSIDARDLAGIVSAPGIDPRMWVCEAIIRSISVDASEGVKADIYLMPWMLEETARVPCCYAGPGFGSYYPLQEGDEVLVACPDGDHNAGWAVVSRYHSPSDPPPAEVVSHPEDVLIRVKSGQTIRILVEDGGMVKLGAEDGIEPAVLGTKLKDYLDAIADWLKLHVHSGGVLAGALTGPMAAPPPFPVSPTTGSVLATKVEVR
jgi:hypothetical protein